MATPRGVKGFDGFPLGVDNRRRETDSGGERGGLLPALREAVNVDIAAGGNIKRRRGYTNVLEGHAHSVWADDRYPFMLAVVDGWLTRYDATLQATPLLEVAPHLPVSYALMNGEVYWSNAETLGRVTAGGAAQPWGITAAGAPSLTSIPAGGMFEGRYLVAQVFMTFSGEISGTSSEAVIDLPYGQGIGVQTAVSDHPDVVAVQVYVSTANGDVMYKAAQVVPGSIALITAGQIGTGIKLTTLHMRSPFPGQIVRAYKGRIYVASGQVLWATEPLRYGLVKPSEALLVFPSEITLLQPVEDGLYVACGSEGTSFLAGNDLMDLQKRPVHASGAVRGTGNAVPGNRFGVASDSVAMWWSADGVLCMGVPGGEVRRLTADKLSVPRYAAGVVGLFEHDGFSQVLSILRDEGTSNNLVAGDSVIAEVRRNGVVIQ